MTTTTNATHLEIAVGLARELGREESACGWNARCFELKRDIDNLVGTLGEWDEAKQRYGMRWPAVVVDARREG